MSDFFQVLGFVTDLLFLGTTGEKSSPRPRSAWVSLLLLLELTILLLGLLALSRAPGQLAPALLLLLPASLLAALLIYGLFRLGLVDTLTVPGFLLLLTSLTLPLTGGLYFLLQ
ncbi:hypothetical protein [Hymenobacter persicinus]|uniref:Uncharacterized protein n=1 Tax=Hymenobacter persicinus TaxID=2025506 RepID=A0A4Q5L833_9BACT|nr:hypothetical protein [Hymenobacter persicinus]RYU77788.1 hypothetical protein EWM57_16810 [Hymenobacter persicinus]